MENLQTSRKVGSICRYIDKCATGLMRIHHDRNRPPLMMSIRSTSAAVSVLSLLPRHRSINSFANDLPPRRPTPGSPKFRRNLHIIDPRNASRQINK